MYKDTDKIMAFVAGLAMYNWGLRVSETSKTLSDKAFIEASAEWAKHLDQHASKAEDHMFGFSTSPLGEPPDNDELLWLSAYACSQSSPEASAARGTPVASGLAVRTSKSNVRGMRDVRFLVVRESPGEEWLIDGLYFVARIANYQSPTDMFFSRKPAKKSRARNPRKRLISAMVAALVKECAVRMNLPP